jgi:dolichyl-diphosphooligosaccharide--protein glycosyltransferase/undecaprenyl-diphosphooligosaccharide--protein glycosyltransferase
LAANLARLSVEEYINRNKAYKEFEKSGKLDEKYKMATKDAKEIIPGPYSPIIDNILRVNQKDQKDPEEFLANLENNNFKLPKKSVDIYLYAPYKMIGIIPAIEKFSNIDLTTGKRERDVLFLPLYLKRSSKDSLIFHNGIKLNYKTGEFTTGRGLAKLKYFIISEIDNNGNIKIIPQPYDKKSAYVLVFLKNYGSYILMDIETFKSNFVQMFLLGNYDKELFDLVVKSPYGRVYRLKK